MNVEDAMNAVPKHRPSKRASVILFEARDQAREAASASASAERTLEDLESLLSSLKSSPLLAQPSAPPSPPNPVDQEQNDEDEIGPEEQAIEQARSTRYEPSPPLRHAR